MDIISGVESLESVRALFVNMEDQDEMPMREATTDAAEKLASVVSTLKALRDQKKVELVF
jgi:hypothetical protein